MIETYCDVCFAPGGADYRCDEHRVKPETCATCHEAPVQVLESGYPPQCARCRNEGRNVVCPWCAKVIQPEQDKAVVGPNLWHAGCFEDFEADRYEAFIAGGSR